MSKAVFYRTCILALSALLVNACVIRWPPWRQIQPPISDEQLNTLEWGDFVSTEFGPNGKPADREPEGPVSVRLTCWNIRYGSDYKKILRALKQDLAADIYLLQEVDNHSRRSGYVNVAQSLARELEMYYVFGVEFQELMQGSKALHGQAVLSRFPITGARVLRFKHQPMNWSKHIFQRRNGGRMALVTEIQTSIGKVVAYNTHLESHGREGGRQQQMQEILDDIAAHHYENPVLIAGDLNTRQGRFSRVLEAARNHGFLDVFSQTGKTSFDKVPLDWILVKELSAVSAVVHSRVKGSDHDPISTQLEFSR